MHTCDVCRSTYSFKLGKTFGRPICPDCARNVARYCRCGKAVYSPYGLQPVCKNCAVLVEDEWFPHCDECKKHTDVYIVKGNYTCLNCFEKNYLLCDKCNQWEHRGHIFSPKGSKICRRCYNKNYFTCYECGKVKRISQARGFKFNTYCTDCIKQVIPSSAIRSDSFDRIKYDRFYGVEIECNYYFGEQNGIWYEKDEHCGTEFVSPLMQGDAGLQEIEDFFYDVEPEFNYDCGLHVHVDVRDFNDQQLFDLIKAIKATKQQWFNYVENSRWHNTFCKNDIPEPIDQDDLNSYFNRLENTRYYWFNLQSVREHGSVEFRLHEATDNIDKVVIWVARIVNFVSEVREMSCV